MQGITGILQRINDIEQRFGTTSPRIQGNFSEALAKAQQGTATAAGTPVSAASTAGGGTIGNMLAAAADKYGVDRGLVRAIAQVESNFEPEVVSSAGAVGVMQLMPETAQELGVHNIRDPRENIDGGVRYLKQMMNTFNGDVTKAIAAYNAGPQAVKTYNGVPPYAETQDYVRKVMAQYR